MAQINLADHSSAILVASNNSALQSFRIMKESMTIPVSQDDVYAIIHKKDGSSFKQELYFGSTYLSSSSRMLSYAGPVVSVTIYNNKGMKREVIISNTTK
jgi:hypothetical protein